MPLGDFEKVVLRLLAANRNPESYIAGATVFLRRSDSHRQSQDIDVFHDTLESLNFAAVRDVEVLEENGYDVEWIDAFETIRRAKVSKEGTTTRLDWAFDSAFRFFPIQSDPELGFVLHQLDGATNKLLALTGRGELRDYLDVLFLHRSILSLGALVWAACGKDLGYTPDLLLEEAQRHNHYSQERLNKLLLVEPIDLVACKRQWIAAVQQARELLPRLPAQELGCLYLDPNGKAVTPDPSNSEFPGLHRHFGTVRGAWPTISSVA